jgi:Tfp pilus assembly protein PilO
MVDRQKLLSYAREVSPKYLVVLYLALLLALAAAVSSLALYPQEARIDARQQQLRQELQKVAAVENYVLTHPDMDKHLQDLQQALLRVEKSLPGSMDVSDFLSALERDARAAGVRLTAVKPGAVTDRTGYREMPLEVSVEGNYFATLSFLKKLEDGIRFNLPVSFLIQQKQNTLATRLNLLIYCYGVSARPTTPAQAAPLTTQQQVQQLQKQLPKVLQAPEPVPSPTPPAR